MKSALECFLKAAPCEHLATSAEDAANRTALLIMATHRPTLGESAREAAAAVPGLDPERQPDTSSRFLIDAR
jgi:hypothetical protein